MVIELLLAHRDLITLEIFDSESDSSKFDSVKFLNLVIVFSGFIFERPCNQPKSVDTLFLLIGSTCCVIQVVPLGILLQKAEAASVGTLCLVDDIIGFIEIDLIIVAYYLSLRLRLETHLDDVA